MKKIIYRGKYGALKHYGFRMQKLYADNRINYILQDKNDVIDNALFISKSGNRIHDFIRSHIDLGRIAMDKDFCAERGLKSSVDDLDENFLRNELNHGAVLVDSIKNGLCDNLQDDSHYINYNKINYVELLYDLRDLTFKPSIVWRGSIFDKNRPTYPIHIQKVSLPQIVFDWLFCMVKSGELLSVDN